MLLTVTQLLKRRLVLQKGLTEMFVQMQQIKADGTKEELCTASKNDCSESIFGEKGIRVDQAQKKRIREQEKLR